MKHKQALKVLMVEDNLSDRRLLESVLLESSNQVALLKCTDSLAGALDLLAQYRFDVAILDLNLTDSFGEETLVKLNKECPHLPIVVNTGAYEEEIGLESLRFGAQDFLVKGKYDDYILYKALYYAIERKRIESELIRATQKIKETQFQLIQAEKMKVVGSLASGVAHEVKNPLSTLLYGVTYLSKNFSEIDPKVETVLANMKEAINRANDIVTDLLNFSSLASMTKKKDNLESVLQKALNLVHHEFAHNRISVTTKIEKYIPDVKMDRNRIEQVLINLILNAVHSMPGGGNLTLSITSKKLSKELENVSQVSRKLFQPGDTVVILTVEDSGFGIPKSKIDQIFEPFFTTRRADGGVGLGLSVSKNIMDIHEGGIFIENKKEGGVCATLIFKVEIPQGGGLYGQKKDLNYR